MRALRPIPAVAIGPARLGSIARRPTLWVEAGVLLTWMGLAAEPLLLHPGSASASGPQGSAGGGLWECMIGMGGISPGVGGQVPSLSLSGHPVSLLATLPMLALMAVAMMVPTAMPAIRHVALNSLYWRRRRAVVEFLAVFVAIWTAFSLLVLGALSAWGPPASPRAAAVALALAALWQLTPLKRRAMLACHRANPLPPRGRRATAGVARFGLYNGGACLLSCWAMMLTTAFVGLPRLVWMALVTTLITVERLNLKPRRTARRVGALLGAAALAAAVFALA
jgi:predicted metal-binding membrane protein